MHIIKRYANRKLYSISLRRYINLEEISERINMGEDIRIQDHKTNEDITEKILARVIFREKPEQNSEFPLSFLTGLIQRSGYRFQALQKNMVKLQNPEIYFAEELESRLQILVSDEALSKEEAEKLQAMLCDPRFEYHDVEDFLQLDDDLDSYATQDEVTELQKELEKLKQELDSME